MRNRDTLVVGDKVDEVEVVLVDMYQIYFPEIKSEIYFISHETVIKIDSVLGHK